MPEPTDHRAEAEKWLLLAQRADIGGPVADSNALIGIGHWLGAIHDALLALGQDAAEKPQDARTAAGNPPCLEWNQAHTRYCLKPAGHADPHDFGTRQPTWPPPLSPSEG